MARDPYSILEVERDAAQDDIAAAYRRLAMENHPDLNKTGDASARMQEINAAYRVVRNPASRSTYDRKHPVRRTAADASAAGAVLFAASTNVVTDIHPVLALVAGLLVAGGVHLVKSAAVRPTVSVTTGGIANVPVSIAEDLLATILSILAIVVPVVVAVVLVLLTTLVVIWLLWRRANRSMQAPRA